MWRQDRRRYHSPLRTLTWPHVVNCQFSCLLISALTTRPNIKHHTCSWNTDCRRKQENWENKRDRTLRYSELRWNQRNTERVEENSRMFWNCPGKMLRLPSRELAKFFRWKSWHQGSTIYWLRWKLFYSPGDSPHLRIISYTYYYAIRSRYISNIECDIAKNIAIFPDLFDLFIVLVIVLTKQGKVFSNE